MGHRPGVKGGYFPVPPVDALQDIRSAMCLALEEMGLKVEVHHHEVATAGQCEIGVKFGTLVKKADEVQILKYAMHNVAHSYGKTATFMPKPLVGDNGNGMHVHQSLSKDGKNLFARRQVRRPVGDRALLHRRHHQAREGASTRSATRAPTATSAWCRASKRRSCSPTRRATARRRSAFRTCRTRRRAASKCASRTRPRTRTSRFAAMLMAGLDGIQNKIHPGDPADKDLYDLEPEEAKNIPTVCHSLDMALEPLDKDREFLKDGGVFTDDVIDAYIGLKMQEVTRLRMSTHPVEFEMYYSV